MFFYSAFCISFPDTIATMRFILLLTFIVSTNACSPKRQKIVDVPCKTPEGIYGHCVPLTLCPKVSSRVVSSSDSITDVLQEDSCGVISHRLHVCCTVNELSKAKLGGKQISATESNGRDGKILDFPTEPTNQHPNRRLLPNLNNCGSDMGQRIYGGKTVDINEFPWLALLRYRNVRGGKPFFSCGGFLISSRYVLTAAHCITVQKKESIKLYRIRLGEWDTNSTIDCQGRICIRNETKDMEVEDVLIHDGYGKNGRAFDIALIRLKKEAELNHFVYPICLPFNDTKNYIGKNLTVAGWGKTPKVHKMNNVKLKVKVPVVDCRKLWFKNPDSEVYKSSICAGGISGEDSCTGDSGGPLMDFSTTTSGKSKWFAVGIVSYGHKVCGTAKVPGVYTKVSAFTDWILDSIKE